MRKVVVMCAAAALAPAALAKKTDAPTFTPTAKPTKAKNLDYCGDSSKSVFRAYNYDHKAKTVDTSDLVATPSLADIKYRPSCGDYIEHRITWTFGDVVPLGFTLTFTAGTTTAAVDKNLWGWEFDHKEVLPNGPITNSVAKVTYGDGSSCAKDGCAISATYTLDGAAFDKDGLWTAKITLSDVTHFSPNTAYSFSVFPRANCKDTDTTTLCKEKINIAVAQARIGEIKMPANTDVCSFVNGHGDKTIPAKLTLDCTGGGGGDPHIWGYNGEGYYFDGEAGKWYAFVHDRDVSMNIRTAPRFETAFNKDFRDIVGLGLNLRSESGVQRVGVFDAREACALGFDTCKREPFEVAVVMNGDLLPLGVTKAGEIEVAVVNTPHQCKFDRDMYDMEKGMYRADHPEMQRQRRLRTAVNGDSLLEILASGAIGGAPSTYNDFVNECLSYMHGRDLFTPRLDGLLTTILIRSPGFNLRVESWGFDPQDNEEAMPANGAVPIMLDMYPQGWQPTESAHGLLGQTIRPVEEGKPVREGQEADYEVTGPYATTFKFYP